MYVSVITPPAPILDLAAAKKHLRVDAANADEDDLIVALVAAATSWIDGPSGWLGRAIGLQTLEARFDYLACEFVALPYGPVVSPIVSFKYLDGDGVEQTLPTSVYQLLTDDRIALLSGQSWPSLYTDAQAVRIRYQAGYPTVPAAIKAAVLLMVGFLYAAREAPSGDVLSSGAVRALLSPFRRWPV